MSMSEIPMRKCDYALINYRTDYDIITAQNYFEIKSVFAASIKSAVGLPGFTPGIKAFCRFKYSEYC